MAVLARFTVALVASLLLAMPPSPLGAKDLEGPAASLYMLDPTYGRTLLQLDGVSLAAIGGITVGGFSMKPLVMNPSAQPPQIVPSADGTHLAAVSVNCQGCMTPMPTKYITVRVLDRSGTVLARFHPHVSLTVGAISDDGRHIGGWGNTAPGTTSYWYTLDGHSGKVLSRVAASVEWPTLYDAKQGRLFIATFCSDYCAGNSDTQPYVLTAYDTATGRQVGRLALDGIASAYRGPELIQGQPAVHVQGVAAALSPDGTRIAIFNGETDKLVLVDPASMKALTTETVAEAQSPLRRLSAALGVLPEAAEAKGVPMGAMVSVRFSHDGSALYVTGTLYGLDKEGQPIASNLGVEKIDVASGQIVARGLQGVPVQWMAEAADGSALYALTALNPSGDEAYQYALRRLDAGTLQQTAERQFEDYRTPQLFVLG